MRAVKGRRRKLLQSFTHADAPGAPLAAQVEALTAALRLPARVAEEADAAALEALGLRSGYCQLLPSFLHCVRWLKTRGAPFSICFRTFGTAAGLEGPSALPEDRAPSASLDHLKA